MNINTISNQLSRLYYRKRGKLVQKMQEEKENGWWYMRGMRFQEFKPSSENRVPSEWLILVYAIKSTIEIGWKAREKCTKKSGIKEDAETAERRQTVDGKAIAKEKIAARGDEIGEDASGFWSRLRGRKQKFGSIPV
jgi:hypothetical protein